MDSHKGPKCARPCNNVQINLDCPAVDRQTDTAASEASEVAAGNCPAWRREHKAQGASCPGQESANLLERASSGMRGCAGHTVCLRSGFIVQGHLEDGAAVSQRDFVQKTRCWAVVRCPLSRAMVDHLYVVASIFRTF